MRYIDIHCHLNLPEYDTDIDEVISRVQKEDVGIINVGIDALTTKRGIELANKNSNMWATSAIHPSNTNEGCDMDIIKKLGQDKKVVAIGECGLDYLRSREEDIPKQKEIFLKHIEIANELGKPLMLHIRNGKNNKDAYKDSIDILKKYSKVNANFHFFAGTLDDLKSILEIGCSVSFTGVITFTKDYDNLVRYTPIDRINSETDSPYVAPIPHRGKRNEPSFVKEVAHKIADIREEPREDIKKSLVDNAKRMFSI